MSAIVNFLSAAIAGVPRKLVAAIASAAIKPLPFFMHFLPVELLFIRGRTRYELHLGLVRSPRQPRSSSQLGLGQRQSVGALEAYRTVTAVMHSATISFRRR